MSRCLTQNARVLVSILLAGLLLAGCGKHGTRSDDATAGLPAIRNQRGERRSLCDDARVRYRYPTQHDDAFGERLARPGGRHDIARLRRATHRVLVGHDGHLYRWWTGGLRRCRL